MPGRLSAEEWRLHNAASAQGDADSAGARAAADTQGRERLRASVVSVLAGIKAATPALERARTSAPEVYRATTAAVQAMVAMARILFPAPAGADAQPQRRDVKDQNSAAVSKHEPREDLEKVALGKLPLPKVGTMRRALNLPVGAARDGRVKVRHADGRSGWVQVRAGMVMSQDGHAVSARNPGGR